MHSVLEYNKDAVGYGISSNYFDSVFIQASLMIAKFYCNVLDHANWDERVSFGHEKSFTKWNRNDALTNRLEFSPTLVSVSIIRLQFQSPTNHLKMI